MSTPKPPAPPTPQASAPAPAPIRPLASALVDASVYNPETARSSSPANRAGSLLGSLFFGKREDQSATLGKGL